MLKAIFVSGTGTGIGKTWVTARLAAALIERGHKVVARKPVQSFAPDDDVTDAEALAKATGEAPDEVCPQHRWYAFPLAPPMAAEKLGADPISLQDLAAETNVPDDGMMLVEGVGGPRSPVADDGDNVDLAGKLGMDRVLLVADAELGTINSTLLAVEAFPGMHVLVFLNRYDVASELHGMNLAWLRDECGLDCFTAIETLADEIERGIDAD